MMRQNFPASSMQCIDEKQSDVQHMRAGIKTKEICCICLKDPSYRVVATFLNIIKLILHKTVTGMLQQPTNLAADRNKGDPSDTWKALDAKSVNLRRVPPLGAESFPAAAITN
jgi:hypothetical protein